LLHPVEQQPISWPIIQDYTGKLVSENIHSLTPCFVVSGVVRSPHTLNYCKETPKYWIREWKTGWNKGRRCGVRQWIWNASGAPDVGIHL